MKIGIATDHGGIELKKQIQLHLVEAGHELVDFGAFEYDAQDDYPDFVIPLARAVANGEVERGVAVCGSGVGACIAANKVKGVRSCLVTDSFSAHQGVEDDDMNLLCLGGRITGPSLAKELVTTFLNANFRTEEKYSRRLRKIAAIEK